MSPRERVIAAVRHLEPDRLPLDYLAEPAVTSALQQRLSARDEEALLEMLGVDVRRIPVPYHDRGRKARPLPSGETEDIWGIRRSGAYGGYPTYHPLAHASTRADVAAHAWPDPDEVDVDAWKELCQQAGPHARLGGPDCRILFDAIEMVGFEKFFTWLYDAPDLVDVIMDKIATYNEIIMQRLFTHAPGELDIVMMVSDFGTQQSLLIKPDMWRRVVGPHFARLFRCARSHEVTVMLHSDGAIRTIIPDLIEMGLQLLNPIQVGANGMQPAGLKRDFGDRLAFHGAIDVQATLPFGTPQDVRAEVQARFRDLGAGGGYICSCSHSLLPDVPVDNIVAMYETAREDCRYR
jgi:uroporphyrinogen decarboxylase